MIRIKRLYTFILGTFFPLLLATFGVCLFIFLMQFLFQRIDELVGKGVGLGVMAEFFFYTSLQFTPLALPLAILLSTLMTFGNLGERLELLAMKASGISLIRIMKPLIVAVIVLAAISFVFQNNVVPYAKVKMYTIMQSLREASPEIAIPEGSFYKDIEGLNVYVREKGKGGILKDLMVYDYSEGFDRLEVTVADSGRLSTSPDKKSLIVTLYSGETFGNMPSSDDRRRKANENIPYRRETFTIQQLMKAIDMNFTVNDSTSSYSSRDISKNTKELVHFIDSATVSLDSTIVEQIPPLKKQTYVTTFKTRWFNAHQKDTIADEFFAGGTDGFFDRLNLNEKIRYLEGIRQKTEKVESEYGFAMMQQSIIVRDIRGHKMKLHEKFSLSLACLLFFFIGAPLGAIIGKGGMGMPAVISVFLYLSYYSIDLLGQKMAKEGVWPVWEGMWLSSLLLALLGIFFTYKAVNDSVAMNPDAWKIALQRLIGKREMRNYTCKEVIIVTPDYRKDITQMKSWNEDAQNYIDSHKKLPFYFAFWRRGFNDSQLDGLIFRLEEWIEDLLNSSENLIIGKLMDYPVLKPFRLATLNRPIVRLACAVVFPIGLTLYFFALYRNRQIINDLKQAQKVNLALTTELNAL